MIESDLRALYRRAPIVLWVEDADTKAYLSAAWGTPSWIELMTAGGTAGVQALVEEAQRDNASNVLGLRDRDEDPRPRTPLRGPVFVTPCHEAENFALDVEALAACELNLARRSVDEIRSKLQRFVSDSAWALAGNAVLATLKVTMTEQFPRSLRLDAGATEQSALAHILNSPWARASVSKAGQACEEAQLARSLRQQHDRVRAVVKDGSWQDEMPGKQLIEHAMPWLCQKGNFRADTAQLMLAVANEQRRAQRVPAFVSELLSALKQTAGAS